MDEIIEVRIEKVIFGGDGLGRLDGLTVFVPATVPGDLVRARVVERKKAYVRARVVDVLSAGADRREPPCPYVARCGGCQLQHVSYPAQLAIKAGFVGEALERIGHIQWPFEIPVLAALEHEWGYRTRTTAHIQHSRHGTQFGFFEPKSHRVVDIASCPLLVPELDAAWRAARSHRADLNRLSSLELAAGDAAAAADPPVAAVGGRDLQVNVHGFAYTFAPGLFFQVNRSMVGPLVEHALASARPGGFALDLFAGVGLFTIPLATRFDRVVAVESNPSAVAYARANAKANGVDGIECHVASVDAFLDAFQEQTRIDFVLLDPPRVGIGMATARRLSQLGAEQITYVSCDPGTLARDLKVLVEHGYRLESVEAVDLFPQTFHVETIATLRRDPV